MAPDGAFRNWANGVEEIGEISKLSSAFFERLRPRARGDYDGANDGFLRSLGKKNFAF